MSSWALPFPLPSEYAQIHIVDVSTFTTIQTRNPHKLHKAGLNGNEDTPNVYLTTEISSTSVKVRFTLATN